MMLTKIAAVRGARCHCLSSVPSRLSRGEISGISEAFRRDNGRSKHSLQLYNINAAPFSHAVRFQSTSSPDTRTKRHSNHRASFNNRGKQKRVNRHEVQQLMDESKGFLKIYKTMDRTHGERKLQQLLLSWGPVIKFLNDDRTMLQQAVQYADSLANIYLDVSLQAESEALPRRGESSAATFVNPAIHGWAKVQRINPQSDAAIRAEKLLTRLLDSYETTRDHFFRPRLHTFNGVLDAFSKSPSKEAPEKAREWLTYMITNADSVSPDRISYNSVLNAYASHGDAMRATALFQEMKEQTSRGLQPDTYSYNMLMKAWQRSGSPQASNATAELLEEFKEAYKRQGKQNLFLRPNTSIYSIPMSLATAEKAHSLLGDLLEWNQREPRKGMQPKAWHYAMVMNAYAKEGQPEKAEELFMQMLQSNREGHRHLQPNLQNFCILIKAWCKQRTVESTKRAEFILEQMEELFLDVGVSSGERLNTYGYNIVMNAHVQSGGEGSAKRVEELFDRMTTLGREHSNPDMLPDRVSYTTLMKAWIQEQSPGYAQRVERLLKQMTEAYEREGIVALKPDVVSYGCVINAWSRSGEPNAVGRAEELLGQMERLSEKGDPTLRPNDFCFNSIINAHAKAGDAEKAESVLRWMEDSYQGGNRRAKPDSVTYTSCIDAWARSGPTEEQNAVRHSQKLFVTMVQKCKDGDVDCKPNPATFTSLMMVLANHKAPEVARFARENLREMHELGIRLNLIAYNALLHACSCATAGKRDALELAITSFHTMKNKRIGVNSITYNSLLHVVNNLVEGEDERQRALEDVFRKCQEDGKVNDIILDTMHRFGLPTSIKHLMNSDGVQSDNEKNDDASR